MKAGTFAPEKSFLYDDEIYRQKLLYAVRKGDIQTAKRLIAKGVDVNFVLDDTLLHTAVSLRRMDILELLLSHPNIDLNIQILKEHNLVTPLLWSLSTHMHGHGDEIGDEFILRLIQAGCDVNISDKFEKTPLHLSMSRSTITVAHELIKRGANINKQCYLRSTALHCAIEEENLEAVCMLLYYNADVYIKCYGHTPLSYAIYLLASPEIYYVLINYYDFLYTDINYSMNNHEASRAFLLYTNGEVFKAVWPRLDHEIILNMSPSFMCAYLHSCMYTVSEWIECLYLMLTSTIGYDLIECHRLRSSDSKQYNFLEELQDSMYRKNVQPKDRLGIIYTVLSLGGIEVQKSDINKVVTLYGLAQDLEALIYGTYCGNKLIKVSCEFVYPPHAYSIGMDTDYTVGRVLQLFVNGLNEWKQHRKGLLIELIFANAIRFFSFPVYIKIRLLRLYPCHNDTYAIMLEERLQNIPEFPSLTEISRNKVHTFLILTFGFKQPYHLQDFVKTLQVPNRIKDIILFKAPIY